MTDEPREAPDAPPDSSQLWGICPRCGRSSTFEVIGSLPLEAPVGRAWLAQNVYPEEFFERVSVFQCRGCGQGTAVVEEKFVGGHAARSGVQVGGSNEYRGIFWWPTPGATALDPSIPTRLATAFSEGIKSLGARAPSAAAVMFRRTVEGIVDDKGTEKAIKQFREGGDLAGAIKIMAKEHVLQPTLAEWAEDVRGLGNIGGHLDPVEEVEHAQAEDLARLTRELLRYLYEEPARAARLRASRVQSEASSS